MNTHRFLNTALVVFWSFWFTHIILRIFHLGRNNAFGFPIVSKFDWYIFHAVAIDFFWILKISLPLFLLAWLTDRYLQKIWFQIIYWISLTLHCLLLLGTVFDQETYRFLGGHLNSNLVQTFGNKSSILMIFEYVKHDLSVKYLPYVLFLGSIPVSILFLIFLKRKVKSPIKNIIVMVIFGIMFWIYKDIIWKGGFRERKLKPLVSIIWENIRRTEKKPLTQAQVSLFINMYQNNWIKEQGDSNWVFSNPEYPFLRIPIHQWCKDNNHEVCLQDKDDDGFLLKKDCNDLNPTIYPGARETPGNGVDEDCNGVDSLPWNIVIIFLESHRAVNAGFLQPYGAFADGTPYLNKLSKKSHVWTRYNTSGLPTVNALFAAHLSTLQHPSKYVATAYPLLKNKSFVQILKERGYQSHFFSSADPAWDNQIPWLTQWYDKYTYNRNRENDKDMFKHMAQWIKSNTKLSQSFIYTAITKTNHYPFNEVPGIPKHDKSDDLQARMIKTMKYTEDGLEDFIISLSNEPWFSKTLFVIMADHGFSLGSHGSSDLGNGLYSEHTWIPMIIFGDHPKLGEPRFHHYPASQSDLGPTLLDLIGITEKNHFMGHSMLRSGADTLNTAFVIRGEQGMLEIGNLRIHGPIGDEPRRQGNEIFNGIKDRTELKNIYSGHESYFDSLVLLMSAQAQLNTYLIHHNKLWEN